MSRLILLAPLACLASPQAVESRLKIRFSTSALSDAEQASREALPSPGIVARAGVASPTRSPWIVANGWRFTRKPGAKYRYDVPAGKAALAAAEAFAYGADAVLKIDPADAAGVGTHADDSSNSSRRRIFRRSPTSASSTTARRSLAR